MRDAVADPDPGAHRVAECCAKALADAGLAVLVECDGGGEPMVDLVDDRGTTLYYLTGQP